MNHVLCVFNLDLAGIGISNGVEGFIREVDGGLASRRRAVVDDGDDDAGSLARLRHAVVGPTGASHRVPPAAGGAVVPDFVARRRNQHSLVLEPVARRGCTIKIINQ